LDRAEDLFRQTIAIDPTYPDAYLHLGMLAEARGDLKLAKDCYIREVNILGGTNRAWVRLFSLQNKEQGAESREQGRGISSPAAIAFLVVCMLMGGALLAYHRHRTRLRRTHG
jgi:tetratricopeptide (TPR) repeat protein